MILTVDEARALRALNVSGRRMLRQSDGWRVHPRGDARTRPLARLDFASVARLLARGRLRETSGGGLVLATELATEPARDTTQPAATPPDPAFIVASAPRTQSRGAGFHGLARQAEHGEGPLSRRAVRAGLTLVKDAEASNRQSGLVMNWSAIPRDRDAQRYWRGGGVDAGARARIKLAGIKARAGEAAFAMSWAACVEGRSLKWLARRFGFPTRNAALKLAEALNRLADAYEN